MSLLEAVRVKLNYSFREEEKVFKYLILRYMAPPRELVIKTELLFRSTLIIGPMNYGKTSFIEAKLGEVIRYLLNEGVEENEISYVYAQETPIHSIVDNMNELDFSKLKYIFIFSDDAAAAQGQFSRRSLSRENISVSRFYTMLRHRIKKKYSYRKYIHVIHASQTYNLIDITFRRCAALKLFKDIPDEPSDLKIIARMLGSAALHALREISLKIAVAKDLTTFLEGIYSCVAYFKGIKRLVRAYRNRDSIEKDVKELKELLSKVQIVKCAEYAKDETNEELSGKATSLVKAVVRIIDELGLKTKVDKSKYLRVRIGKRWISLGPIATEYRHYTKNYKNHKSSP